MPCTEDNGDIDNDLSVDLTDTIRILLLMIHQENGMIANYSGSDVNRDGVIGITEALFTLQYQDQPE